MHTTTRTTIIGASCLVLGLFIGAAGVQARQMKELVHYLNSGLFTIGTNEGAEFRVTLDDHSGAPPAQVALQFYDGAGTVVLTDRITLQPGQSSSIQLREPGLYRAHAAVLEPSSRVSDRRVVVGTVELFDSLSIEPKRPVCMIAGPGRIPDAQER